MWIDIASIVFICVTMNHLGPIKDVEAWIGMKIPVIGCVKCCTFWVTLLWCCVTNATEVTVHVLAISFLASYLAIWFELFEGYIDTLYMKVYEKIYPNTDNDAPASDTDNGDSAGSVS